MRWIALLAVLWVTPGHAQPCRPLKGPFKSTINPSATVRDWAEMLMPLLCRTIAVSDELADVELGGGTIARTTASKLWQQFGALLKKHKLKLSGGGAMWKVTGKAAQPTIARAEIDAALADPSRLTADVDVQWVVGEGNVGIGYERIRVAPSSLVARLGLRRGDVLIEANGQALDSPANALGAVRTLRTADRLAITVIRDGRSQTWTYNVR